MEYNNKMYKRQHYSGHGAYRKGGTVDFRKNSARKKI